MYSSRVRSKEDVCELRPLDRTCDRISNRIVAWKNLKYVIHSSFGIRLGHNLIESPFRHIYELYRDRVVPDPLFHPLNPFFFSGHAGQSILTIGDHNEQPFVPWLDHSGNSCPSKHRMLLIWLQEPVEGALAMFHIAGEICSDKNVECSSLIRLNI